jgi:hypothetical protein
VIQNGWLCPRHSHRFCSTEWSGKLIVFREILAKIAPENLGSSSHRHLATCCVNHSRGKVSILCRRLFLVESSNTRWREIYRGLSAFIFGLFCFRVWVIRIDSGFLDQTPPPRSRSLTMQTICDIHRRVEFDGAKYPANDGGQTIFRVSPRQRQAELMGLIWMGGQERYK